MEHVEYEARVDAMVEQDDYEQGCIGGITNHGTFLVVRKDTLDALIEYVEDYIGSREHWEAVEWDNDPATAVLQTSRLEDAGGDPATDYEIESWKQGNTVLYCVDYTVRIQKLIKQDIDFQTISKAIEV